MTDEQLAILLDSFRAYLELALKMSAIDSAQFKQMIIDLRNKLERDSEQLRGLNRV